MFRLLVQYVVGYGMWNTGGDLVATSIVELSSQSKCDRSTPSQLMDIWEKQSSGRLWYLKLTSIFLRPDKCNYTDRLGLKPVS